MKELMKPEATIMLPKPPLRLLNFYLKVEKLYSLQVPAAWPTGHAKEKFTALNHSGSMKDTSSFSHFSQRDKRCQQQQRQRSLGSMQNIDFFVDFFVGCKLSGVNCVFSYISVTLSILWVLL